MVSLEGGDLRDLKRAKALLENSGIAAKFTDLIGSPIEKGIALLPVNWNQKVAQATQTALQKAVDTAVLTMNEVPGEEASNAWHKLVVATSGGIGGFFGLAALAVELPVSTTIMLRSIADVARSEGEAIGKADAKIACIEVFALGGPSARDDASDAGYFAVRAALATAVSEATAHLAEKGLAQESAPALVRLIIQVAERFSIQVSQKAAAQAIPALGAVGGALINTLFIDHFQNIACGHFIVRRLERKYGKDLVAETYGRA